MEDQIKFKRRIYSTGGETLAVTIPRPLIKYLGFEKDTPIIMCVDERSHGKFIAFWIDTERLAELNAEKAKTDNDTTEEEKTETLAE